MKAIWKMHLYELNPNKDWDLAQFGLDDSLTYTKNADSLAHTRADGKMDDSDEEGLMFGNQALVIPPPDKMAKKGKSEQVTGMPEEGLAGSATGKEESKGKDISLINYNNIKEALQ